MSSWLNSTKLLEHIKRKGHIPNSQVTFQDDDLLAFANEEMQIGLVPSVLQMHEEYFVYPLNVPLVANTSSYDIPPRSIGQKVREVFYLDVNSNYREMARINPDQVPYYGNSANDSLPRTFIIENNSIVLLPTIGSSPVGSIMFKYFMRPNELVVYTDNVCQITAIDSVTGILTVDQIPSAISNNVLVDMQEQVGGHRLKGYDITISSVNSSTNTINITPSLIPSNLSIGDYISPAGTCFIPMLPDELHSVLAQRVVCELLESQKDTEGLSSAKAKLAEMEAKTQILIDNRTEGQPKKVVSMHSPLRTGKFRYRRNIYT